MSDDGCCPYCGESTADYGPSNIEPVRVTDARGRTVRRAAHVFCANVAAIDPPFIGYCNDCGAKHGVEEERDSHPPTCMCGGDIHPVEVLDTVDVTVNGSSVAFPTSVPPEPGKLLEVAGFDPREYELHREDVDGACSEPLVVDEGDAFTAHSVEA